ncbi:MAG: hypothetical protein FJY11_03550 [Bacteroidetes bacterium]|nr:hypothetical protein [Bacteroidota bacterium]
MARSFVAYLLSILSLTATGQIEKQLLPSDIKQQTVVTEPVTLSRGFFRSGFWVSYGVVDKYFDYEGTKKYYLNSTWGSATSYLFNFQYGITSRLMVDINIPVNSAREQFSGLTVQPEINADAPETSNLKGKGIGDGSVRLAFQVIDEKNHRISLTGTLEATIPTGEKNPTNIRNLREYNLPTGSGFWSTGGKLMARTILYPYSITAYAGYVSRFSGKKLATPSDLAETEFRDGNSFEAGGSFNLHLNDWIVTANHIRYLYKGEGEIREPFNITVPPVTALFFETQLIFQVGQLRIGESVRIPLAGKRISADPRFEMLVQYVF